MIPRPTLAFDVGTRSVRAILFDSEGVVVSGGSRTLQIRHPAPGRAEQDPHAMLQALRELLDEQRVHEPATLGLAVQRSSVCFWNSRSRAALAPVLGWQDTRAVKFLEELARHEREIARRTGLRLSPHYGASKLAWMLAHAHEQPGPAAALADGDLSMGPLAAWLLAGLRDDPEPVVDHANASRTLLWNLKTRDWDPWLLDLFQLPAEALPRCLPILHDYGQVAGTGMIIRAVSGDQNAAIFGGGPLPPDTALVNLGTGAFVLCGTGAAARPHEQLLTGLSESNGSSASYLLEGTVNGAGAALAWAEGRWGLLPLAPRLDSILRGDAEPALFVNAVGGLGSPFWRHDLESRLVDERRFVAKGRIRDGEAEVAVVKGIIESVLFLIRANLELMQAVQPLNALRVSGGLSRSNPLCERLASLCTLPVERPREREATARGIAWLAASKPENWRPVHCDRFPPREDAELLARYISWRAITAELCA